MEKNILVEVYDKTLEEASAIVEARGMQIRVVAKDGEYFLVTQDLKFDRVNVSLVNNIVKEANVG